MPKLLLYMAIGAVASWAGNRAVEFHCEYMNRVDQCKLVAVPVTGKE
jgi:hypothetical protein